MLLAPVYERPFATAPVLPVTSAGSQFYEPQFATHPAPTRGVADQRLCGFALCLYCHDCLDHAVKHVRSESCDPGLRLYRPIGQDTDDVANRTVSGSR